MNWAFQKDQREDTSSHFHIFVGDLASEFNDAALFEAFKQCPGCSEARVMWDHTTNRSKGYGFVAFRCVPARRANLFAIANVEYAGNVRIMVVCAGTSAFCRRLFYPQPAAEGCACLLLGVLDYRKCCRGREWRAC